MRKYVFRHVPAPKRDHGPMVKMMNERRVERWEEFPPATRSVYEAIAACYPGHQVHACGSRVKGYYSDAGDTEAQSIRMALGIKKPVSDYDFIAPLGVEPCMSLPSGADKSSEPVMQGQCVPIPIAPDSLSL